MVTPFVDKTCPICKRVFTTNNPRKRYCSDECYNIYQEKRNSHKKHNQTERVCALCGKTFYSSHFMQKYCSHACYDESKVKRSTRVRDGVLNKE
jgi:predicted nucleic acid-binding Zn ribbon protein